MSEQNNSVSLVIVGSIGIDDIETPRDKREAILGGSASYACAGASFFTPPGMVGIVGQDFSDVYLDQYRRFGIDLAGLEKREGKTFRWSGVYEENMDERRTLKTELNLLAEFDPTLPDAYRRAPYLFLGNIAPSLQLHVLDQMADRCFTVADTMDLWIQTAEGDLKTVIERVDMLTLNESEARHLTGRHGLVRAARDMLAMGPRYVLIKKGEHGSILFTRENIFLIPAFPLEEVHDPTGAGDSFAGGFMGALTLEGEATDRSIRKSMLYGSVVASFAVEQFSLDRLADLNAEQIEERTALFRDMIRVD